jgi:hypothetical protein
VPRQGHSGKDCLKNGKCPSSSALDGALGEEDFNFFSNFFPECCARGRGFLFKKKNFFPECCTRGRGFFKKNGRASTASNLSRVLVWHSGKASPSVRFLALGEDLFPVRGIPGRSSPSVTLGEGFLECIWHSGKPVSAVVGGHHSSACHD